MPRPISETRKTTTRLTSVSAVSPQTASSVTGIATIAQQRYEGECGREDEHQHDQGSDAGDERLVQKAGTAALAWRFAGQQRGPRQSYLGAAHARAGDGLLGARGRGVAGLVPARPGLVDRVRRRMHDRERGAAVVGDVGRLR